MLKRNKIKYVFGEMRIIFQFCFLLIRQLRQNPMQNYFLWWCQLNFGKYFQINIIGVLLHRYIDCTRSLVLPPLFSEAISVAAEQKNVKGEAESKYKYFIEILIS